MGNYWQSDLGKLFGLSGRERSLLGKHAQRIVNHQRMRRGLSIFLVSLTTAIFLIRSFSNLGGPLTFNANVIAAPTVTIDPSTISSVQKPIDYVYESRGYSWFHSGADLVAPVGTTVRPIMEGTVTYLTVDGWGSGYGKHIIVSHREGYESLYGHLSQVEVAVGQKVGLIAEIGKSGNTGLSTGPHLHLEVHQNGAVINPAEVVPGVQ